MHDDDGITGDTEQHPRRTLTPALLLVALASGWWITGLTGFSAGATAAVLGAGAASIAIGWRLRGPPSPAGPDSGLGSVAAWAALVVALLGWQVAAYVQHPRSDHPTLSSLTNEVLDARPIRAVAFAAWMVVAGWLVRR